MVNSVSKFLYILKGKYKALLILMLMFVAVSFLEAVSIGLVGPFIGIAMSPDFSSQPSILQTVYKSLGMPSKSQFLLIFGSSLIAVFCFKSIINIFVFRKIINFGSKTQGDLQTQLMRSYLAAPYTFHLDRNTASLIQSIIKDTNVFRNGVLTPVLFSASNIAIIISLILLLIVSSPLATLIISGLLLMSYGLFHSLKDKLARWGSESAEASTEIIRTINHGLGGVKETLVIGCESYFNQQMEVHSQKLARLESNNMTISTIPRYVLEALLMTSLVIITFVFIAFNQQSSQQLNSILGIFALASVRLMPAASNLIGTINTIRFSKYTIDKIYFDLKETQFFDSNSSKQLSKQSKVVTGEHHFNVLKFNREVELKDVVYRYPGAAENALNGVCLPIKRGQSIGLIGRSGAGKTTIVDVIFGLLTPQSGDIKVDGVSIYDDIRSWQNLIGYVPQSIFLMDDTLEKNVAFGIPSEAVDRQRLYAALESAQLLELVESLPDGLRTVIGESGVRLSGGQRQRIGIARALYHQREILVLDEATAALDNETERLVNDSIKSLSGTKTIIIIAHRLSTIEHCDCIYLMEKGRVVKSGTYQEVITTS